jgi:hypothetical protein
LDPPCSDRSSWNKKWLLVMSHQGTNLFARLLLEVLHLGLLHQAPDHDEVGLPAPLLHPEGPESREGIVVVQQPAPQLSVHLWSPQLGALADLLKVVPLVHMCTTLVEQFDEVEVPGRPSLLRPAAVGQPVSRSVRHLLAAWRASRYFFFLASRGSKGRRRQRWPAPTTPLSRGSGAQRRPTGGPGCGHGPPWPASPSCR